MSLQRIIICDHRAAVLDSWRKVFSSHRKVAFSKKASAAESLEISDALVMMAAIAHDQFGGEPILGKSQILDGLTKQQYNRPRWIVTTVPFPAEIQSRQHEDGTTTFVVVRKPGKSDNNEVRILFHEILTAVDEFNIDFDDGITTLRIDLDWLNFEESTSVADAASALSAIRQRFKQDVSRPEAQSRTVFFSHSYSESLEGSALSQSLVQRSDLIRDVYIPRRVKREMEERSLDWNAVIWIIMNGDLRIEDTVAEDLQKVSFSLRLDVKRSEPHVVRATLDRGRGRIAVKSIG